MLRLVAKRYQTCLNVVQYLIKCLTSFKFYQTRSSTIKQDIQSGNCSVTKRCLIVFARQTFPVWLGLKRDEYFTKLSENPFRTKQINKNRFWLIWLPPALIIRDILHSVIEEIQFKWLRYFNARVFF